MPPANMDHTHRFIVHTFLNMPHTAMRAFKRRFDSRLQRLEAVRVIPGILDGQCDFIPILWGTDQRERMLFR